MRDDYLRQTDPPAIPLDLASCAYHLNANYIQASFILCQQSKSPKHQQQTQQKS